MHHELISEGLVSAINTFKNMVDYRKFKLPTFSMQIICSLQQVSYVRINMCLSVSA